MSPRRTPVDTAVTVDTVDTADRPRPGLVVREPLRRADPLPHPSPIERR